MDCYEWSEENLIVIITEEITFIELVNEELLSFQRNLLEKHLPQGKEYLFPVAFIQMDYHNRLAEFCQEKTWNDSNIKRTIPLSNFS